MVILKALVYKHIMTKLKCNLIVKETQTTSAKVLNDLNNNEQKDFDVEAIFNEALENDDPTISDGKSLSDNPQHSKVKKE